VATPIRVTITLKGVWGVDTVHVITDDGADHYVPMTSTMQNVATQAASIALGLFGQPQPSAYGYGHPPSE
jgi:hypothetical protein